MSDIKKVPYEPEELLKKIDAIVESYGMRIKELNLEPVKSIYELEYENKLLVQLASFATHKVICSWGNRNFQDGKCECGYSQAHAAFHFPKHLKGVRGDE